MPIRAGNIASDTIGSAMWEKQKRPRGISSGRKLLMIKGYVKGARNVKLFLCVESTCSVDSKKQRLQGGFSSWLKWPDFG